jgi:hypothetical protein
MYNTSTGTTGLNIVRIKLLKLEPHTGCYMQPECAGTLHRFYHRCISWVSGWGPSHTPALSL